MNDSSKAEIAGGYIEIDSHAARVLGFTSDKFEGWLWRAGDDIVISFIVSKARGNFRELVQKILSLGLNVLIPTPLGRMQEIVRKNGYIRELSKDGIMGAVETWRLNAGCSGSRPAVSGS